MSKDKKPANSRGGRIGFWFFKTSLRALGLSGTYGFLYFVCFHYLLFDRAAVSVSMAYVKRRFPYHNGFQRYLDVYRIFIDQGKSLIDRYYAASGQGQFDTSLYGYDRVKDLMNESPQGAILLTAHVGDWQFAMTALSKLGKTVYLMMRPEENAAAEEALKIQNENGNVKIISTGNYLGGVIEALEAIRQGNIVSIMGDRPYEYKTMETDFMGEKARFPYGAFSMAAAVQCPVVVLLSAKLSVKTNMVDISNIIEPAPNSRGKRQEGIKECVDRFAKILEGYVAAYPYQWFVFEDLWK